MNKEIFTKVFDGYRKNKRFSRELEAAKHFPDITPKVMSSNPDELEINFEFIHGDIDVCNDDTLSSIGTTLASIHQSSKFVSAWETAHVLSRYKRLPDPLFQRFNEIKDSVEEPRYGVTHGDYRRRNIISSDTGVKVVDWEFMGKSFVYWDIGIFVGDYVHNKYHGLQANKLQAFWNAYTSKINLNKSEVEFCIFIGGLDIVSGHLLVTPGEKSPIPEELFYNFTESEQEYLLYPDNYE